MKAKADKMNIRRKGVAYIFALLLLAIMTSLAIGMGSGLNLVLQRPENSKTFLSAQLAAESGISYLRYHVSQPMIQPTATGSGLMEVLYDQLISELGSSPAVIDGAISLDTSTNTISIPNIRIDDDRWFNADISMVSPREVRLKVNGFKKYRSSSVCRTCSIDLEPFASNGTIFQNGIVTNGRFVMRGNGDIQGLHDNAEANILCAGSEIEPLVDLSGNCSIRGSIYVQQPDQAITLRGNIQVGDQYYHSQTITQETIQNNPSAYQSMLIGTEPVTFPTMDSSIFEPFAVNIVDENTNLSGIYDLENIRIKANTNPNFSGNFNIHGVIYIEQPNQVHFSGNVNITGVIATETAIPSDENYILFTGNQTLSGVDSLPDTPQFVELKKLRGTFLLAPGFETKFTGNIQNVGGTLASEKFTFCGNTDMDIEGSIISYGGEDFSVVGNSFFTFNKESVPEIPSGFLLPGQFGEVQYSYREY